MSKLATVSILFFIQLTAFGQSSFYKALTALSHIDYVLIASKNCRTQNIQDNLGCYIQPIDNWFNRRLKARKMNDLDTIDYSKITTIESFAIKGTKELEPRTYGRADLIKWTFLTTCDARNAESTISKAALSLGEDLYKAPYRWWRHRENIYFILTAGTYTKPDLNRIEIKLKGLINGG